MMMMAANQFLKRILPCWSQRAIYRFLWNPVRDAYWRRLKLGCELPSGLQVEVRNRSDWTIYNEVLVNGEYDLPIDTALSRREAGRRFTVIDLGGNVGYFTFRCADRFLQRNDDKEALEIIVVEGSPTVFNDLQRRVGSQPLLGDKVTVRLGLVGRKTGEAFIGGSHIHYGNVVSSEPAPGAARVPFIDLDREFAAMEKIDLLKCDIEGAEFEFVDNFELFLRKVNHAVLEFHRYGKSIEQCRQTLRRYGFTHSQILRDTPTFQVEFYWR